MDRRSGRREKRLYKKEKDNAAKTGTKQDEKENMEAEYTQARQTFKKIIIQ